MFKENDIYFFFFLSERIVLFFCLFACLFLNTVFTFAVCAHSCELSHYSRVQLFATLWTAAHQAPLSMGFSRQENWSGLPCPPPEDVPDPEIEPAPLMSLVLTGGFNSTT